MGAQSANPASPVDVHLAPVSDFRIYQRRRASPAPVRRAPLSRRNAVSKTQREENLNRERAV
jgi:hypothetical protein